MKLKPIQLLIILGIMLNANYSIAQIESQWKGPERNSMFAETGLLQEWPEGCPELLWRLDSLGLGHSSAAVTDEAIFLTGMPDSTGGVLYALDLEGNLIWQDKYGPDWNTNFTGTRSTPTVAGDHLYFISGFGVIYCYDIRKKEKVWTRSFIEDFKVEPLKYGISESPLVDGFLLYCTPGGTENNVVCLNRITGEMIWTSKGMGEETSYSSSIMVVQNGNKMLVCVTKNSIFALDHQNGNLLWHIPHDSNEITPANTPVYYKGKIFMACEAFKSKGGLMAIQLSESGKEASILWQRNTLRNLLSGFIILEDHIYTSTYREDDWHCLNALTGETVHSWKGGYGTISYADNRFYIMANMGAAVLCEGSPDSFNTVSICKLDIQPYYPFMLLWSPPVIKDKKLYIRHKGSLFVYDIGADRE